MDKTRRLLKILVIPRQTRKLSTLKEVRQSQKSLLLLVVRPVAMPFVPSTSLFIVVFFTVSVLILTSSGAKQPTKKSIGHFEWAKYFKTFCPFRFSLFLAMASTLVAMASIHTTLRDTTERWAVRGCSSQCCEKHSEIGGKRVFLANAWDWTRDLCCYTWDLRVWIVLPNT